VQSTIHTKQDKARNATLLTKLAPEIFVLGSPERRRELWTEGPGVVLMRTEREKVTGDMRAQIAAGWVGAGAPTRIARDHGLDNLRAVAGSNAGSSCRALADDDERCPVGWMRLVIVARRSHAAKSRWRAALPSAVGTSIEPRLRPLQVMPRPTEAARDYRLQFPASGGIGILVLCLQDPPNCPSTIQSHSPGARTWDLTLLIAP